MWRVDRLTERFQAITDKVDGARTAAKAGGDMARHDALHTLTDDQCWPNFRFVKQDIARLATLLSLPDVIRVSNGCVCSRVDALYIVLRRFAYPNRLCDLESFFVRPSFTLSLIINETVHQLWSLHRHRLTSLDLSWLQQDYLQQYSDTTHMKAHP